VAENTKLTSGCKFEHLCRSNFFTTVAVNASDSVVTNTLTTVSTVL